jgi:hypothetical protein
MNTRITQAVATALALGTTAGAYAVDMSTVAAGSIVYVSGSTAIDPGLQSAFTNTVDGLCGAAIDVYAGTNAGVKFQAVACTGGAHAGGNNGVAIAYIKEDNAGSLNGITPVNNATAIAFPSSTLMTAANCGAASPHTCGTNVTAVNVMPNYGFSDVNAELFANAGLAAPTGNLTENNSVDTAFGIAASLGFYHALQQLQLGLTGTNADDTEAHMPALTRGQAYTLLVNSAGLLPPSFIVNSAGTTNAGATLEVFGSSSGASHCGTNATCATADANTVYTCVRGQSSGTMQTSQAYFGSIDCAGGVSKFNPPTVASCATDGCSWAAANNTNAVFAGSGTGDVLSCLQGQDAVGHFAIGIVGLENAWSTDQTNTNRRDWRFVKINDVVPSLENIASDRYEYWAQSAGYAPNAGRPNVAAGVAGVTAGLLPSMGTAAVIQGLNAGLPHTVAPVFHNGFLAIPSVGTNTPNASSVTNAGFVSNPVNSFTRGLPSNNCQRPTLDVTAPDSSTYPTWETTQP